MKSEIRAEVTFKEYKDAEKWVKDNLDFTYGLKDFGFSIFRSTKNGIPIWKVYMLRTIEFDEDEIEIDDTESET